MEHVISYDTPLSLKELARHLPKKPRRITVWRWARDGVTRRDLLKVKLETFGVPLQSRFIGGWGDMRLLGSPEVILYGPGGGGGDHHYNEYFELASLTPTLVTLGLLTARWCGEN